MKPNFGRGDTGETDLRGTRVKKCECNVESIGNIDELNSFIGYIRSVTEDENIDSILEKVQNDLFVLGSDLASPVESNVPRISRENVEFLEKTIDEMEMALKPLNKFILPTGTKTASLLHIARAICRRAERSIVALSQKEKINEQIIPYVNRLSDLLFVMARFENRHIGDVVWEK
jgi:cob(I)alamin adenosyltransferase